MIKSDQNNQELNPTINSEITGTDKLPILQPTSQQILPYTKEGLRVFAKEIAILYGLDWEKFDYTIQNESDYNSEARNSDGSCIGAGQFLLDTWLGNCSKTDERTDGYKAIECMGKMWSKGMEFHWDAYCFKYPDTKCAEIRHLYPKTTR
jgi:hypothetical protein